MNTQDILLRLARMEDIEAIRQLKHEYCAACDDDYDVARITSLFTPDGVWDSGAFHGAFRGHAEIAQFFEDHRANVDFCAHQVLNERISIDGDTATAHWRSIIPATLRIDGDVTDYWLFTGYRDELVKRDGQWLFSRMTSIPYRSGTHSQGWRQSDAVVPEESSHDL